MILLKLAFGILFFVLGWIYLYKSNIVLNLNRFVRETIFSDRLVLLKRNKLAILFFCLSFIALYMALATFTAQVIDKRKNVWMIDSTKYLMYMAMQDYCNEKYQNAIEKYLRILKSEPNNYEVLKRLAYTYDAAGEKKTAKVFWKRILKETTDNNAKRQ